MSHTTPIDTNTKSREIGDTTHKTTSDRCEDLEHEEVPEINWYKLSARVLKDTSDDHTQETVSAKLYLLAKDQAVFWRLVKLLKYMFLILKEMKEEDDGMQQIKHSKLIVYILVFFYC